MGRSERDRRERSRSRSPSHRKSARRDRSRSPRSRSKDRTLDRSDRHHHGGSKSDRGDHNKSSSRRSDRSGDGHRRRSRSRERDTITKDAKKQRDTIEEVVGKPVDLETFDIDEQQRKLEAIMQQRRERVEKWRREHAKKSSTDSGSGNGGAGDESSMNGGANQGGTAQADDKKKTWTLDDSDDDEDGQDGDGEDSQKSLSKMQMEIEEEPLNTQENHNEPKPTDAPSESSESELDPLDAFMATIQDQVKSSSLQSREVREKDSKSMVKVVVGVAKSKSAPAKQKGELIEQNQDALEYSSEDEDADQSQDLNAAMSSLNNASSQANKIKKLITIRPEDIAYQPFRKDFYVEVAELARLTAEEVEAYRVELEGIQVKGKGCPKPIKTWAHAGVSLKVMDTLKRLNYDKPTPIQAQAIPAIMSGRDIIGIAKTGSGKTLAFLIPMLRHILDQPELDQGDGPIAIIMAPTRELCTQIWSECKRFAKPLGLRTVAVYGGTPISEQIGELKPGAEIVVCTPGRMIDMLAANSGRVTNLRRCTYLVLDEADRMFDMGFEPQVMRIIDGIRPDRQTVMFSATFPRIMEALARRILTRPIEIQVGGRSQVCAEVQQNIVVIDEDDKFLKLLEVLGRHAEDGSAIVFVDKQENADGLLKELMMASYTCLVLHGGVDQSDRDSTIVDFKNGKAKVLVATSVAARGLDVKHCIVVVNYDCPNHYEDYVHRCGRTGRAGNKGFAYTFITPEQGRYAGEVIKALTTSGVYVPDNLNNLWEDYKRTAESEGRKIKSSSGFAGKGFKFDEAEALIANEKKKFQKAALGLQDSDDEDAEADIDQEIETMLAPKKSVKQIAAPVPPTATVASISGPGSGLPTSMTGAASISDKMEAARRAALRINASVGGLKGPGGGASSTTEAFLKGDPLSMIATASKAVMAKSKAEQLAERLNAKLNYVRSDDDEGLQRPAVPGLDDDDLAGGSGQPEMIQRFEEELEINEFPQQARWKVTSKEAIQQISEYSEAGITVRGTYFPAGKEPAAGERKLYLAIEGTSELSVSKARVEIIRLIKEELLKLQNSYNMWPNKAGRYKVV